ncbi:MAG TPA: sigma-70 family RNA polymerase sigma factor [Terriglobales bacterium]|nr:sigma-70 family RNA polymerase sigma factor [Terriglobales bacterium]
MRPEIIEAANLLRTGEVEKALPLLQNTVFSFSMKVCGHREDAEDTTQDVLLTSVKHLANVEEPQALAVWLYKVTRNRCWMSRRRSKFAPQHTLSLDELMPDSEELASLTKDGDHSPEHQVISKQEARRVHEAVLRIPPQYRLILVLHDMEDLNTSEVAKITGLREGTVRVRLHRARLFVRRELASPSKSKKKKRGRLARPVECKRLFAALSEYIDKRVDDLSCEKIEKHLADCPPCIAFVNDLSRAVDRCKSLEVPCDTKTSASLKRLLEQEFARLSESQPS